MLKSRLLTQDGKHKNQFLIMPNYFKNLEQTMASVNNTDLSVGKKIKFWMINHLRIIWSLIMMLILSFICLWVSLKVSGENPSGSIIENVVPEMNQSNDKMINNTADSMKGDSK